MQLTCLNATPQKQRVGAFVWPHPLPCHSLHHLEGPCQLTMRGASVKQIVVDVHVELQPVLLRKLVHKLKGAVRPLAAVRELHQHRECEGAGGHARAPHLLQHAHALLEEPALGATVNDGVVCDLIRLVLLALLHGFEEVKGLVEPALLAIALDDGAVGHKVGLDVLGRHVLQKSADPCHLASACACINESIEGDNGELEFLFPHFLVDSPNAVKGFLVGEALEHRAINDRIQEWPGLLVRRQPADELVSALGVAVGDESLHHATDRDAGGHNVLRAHLLPCCPRTT
mmetsp:Transcript_97810/g.226806  ORF Transcript_97810/g.226806 Transcript_97810/m.226806 type:complete len:287 (+) Transcript_97810:431-1291(+)